ncbi:hypothetical protein [Holophaga foetida]|uniref:hypothetical protein n=1 Tax=Holophaga foetida TaxID=35839 RepID=UPI0011DDEF88|nr:hypothetical protein [Holophaga foetida]
MTSKFHTLEDIRFSNGVLSILVADLNEGEPDEFIGLPLVITNTSHRHLVKFPAIAGFQSVPEPLNGLSSTATRITAYLYLDPDSEYLAELQIDGPSFVFGAERPDNPSLSHYVVYGENTVVHILSATIPEIISPYDPA